MRGLAASLTRIFAAIAAGRVTLDNSQASGSKPPESDREDMEVFLGKIRQLLPVLGSDLATPLPKSTDMAPTSSERLGCEIKGLKAEGRRTSEGFLAFEGSQAVMEVRPSAATRHPFVLKLGENFEEAGTLVQKGDHLVFGRDVEFSSPGAAASAVPGGGSCGPTAWNTQSGQSLEALEV